MIFVSSLVSIIVVLDVVFASVVPDVTHVNNNVGIAVFQSFNLDDNLVVSPPVATASLVTLLMAAKGESADALRTALEMTPKTDEKSFSSLLKPISEIKSSQRLISSEKPKKDFKTIAKQLESEIISIDFSSKQSAKDLTLWSLNASDGRIAVKDILDSKQQLISIGVVVAKFTVPMRPDPRERDFHNFVSYSFPGMASRIPFFSTETELKSKDFSEEKSISVLIDLNQDLSLFLVLPKTSEDLEFLNENLTQSLLEKMISETTKTTAKNMRLIVPQIRVESEIDLKDVFEELNSNFDFSKGFDSKTEIKVSNVLQKVALEVSAEDQDEDQDQNDKDEPTPGVPELVFDRPFVFALLTSSGTTVLLGRIQSLFDEKVLSFQFI
ncbi:serpin I2-like [Oppia nitens]|uniref:serpin I2-like n=1 Tax=Oppia nitens TaxID=1686743 RepID=UPI0023DC1B32|nr:serpin I2-like [Oppia nitens]